jgi:hypothetical protein
MGDLLADGAAMLDRVRKTHLSRTVTYLRGTASVELAATPGKTTFQVDNGLGVLESFESRDYIVTAADLVLDGQRVRPERGDRIRDTVGGTVQVYEVMAPGREQHYRLAGPDQSLCRIHTKLVDIEG